jgi:DnaK suppressor protein
MRGTGKAGIESREGACLGRLAIDDNRLMIIQEGQENSMDKKRLKQYEAKLIERRNQLLNMVERTEDYGREADRDVSQDPADKASNSYTKELLFSQSTNERNTLRLIEEAIARVTDGSFGECVNCGEEIQPKRLDAIPWTPHCIRCQELVEQGLLNEKEI